MAAGLNNTNADALASAICSALGVTDAASQTKYQEIYRLVYSHLKSDIEIILQTGTVVTTGSATTQTGPAVPVDMSPQ